MPRQDERDQDEQHQDEQHQDEQNPDEQNPDEQELPRTATPSPGAFVGITVPTNPQDDPVGGGDDE
jgi:hypothetical protein